MPRYLGVDPGAKGSLCFLDPHGDIYFYKTPDIYKNSLKLFNDIRSEVGGDPPLYAAVEDVHSLFGMSAKSNFTFGRSIQAIHTFLHLVPVEFELVQPKVWQKAVGIPSKKALQAQNKGIKEAVATRALALYPNVSLFGPRGGLLDGRADALMLAHYLYLKYGTNP